MFCVSHGLKGPNVFFDFASFDFSIGASLLTCSRQLSYRRMNVRVERGGCWDHFGGSLTLEEKIHLGAAFGPSLPVY